MTAEPGSPDADPASAPAASLAGAAAEAGLSEPLGALGALEEPARFGPLVRDMQRALRSEFGAFSFYSLLPGVTRNAELEALLRELRRDQTEIIGRLQSLISSLGGTPATSRWTRSVAAWGLLFLTPVLGRRFALRMCFEAERTVARWHAEYAVHLLAWGQVERAREANALAEIKSRHAVRLETFVNNIARR